MYTTSCLPACTAHLPKVARIDAFTATPKYAVAPRGRTQLLLRSLLVRICARLELVRRGERQGALCEAEEAAARSALNIELVLLSQLLQIRSAALRLFEAALCRNLQETWRYELEHKVFIDSSYRLYNAVIKIAEPDDII